MLPAALLAGPQIEQVFAELKALLCRAAPKNRQALWTRIGTLLDRFSPAECQNYIANAGYGTPT